MKKIKLNNGTYIPQLGLGTWELTGKTCNMYNFCKECIKTWLHTY